MFSRHGIDKILYIKYEEEKNTNQNNEVARRRSIISVKKLIWSCEFAVAIFEKLQM